MDINILIFISLPYSRGSRYSQPARSVYSYRSGAAPSVASTRRTRRSAGVKAEAMVAPNPFCPNVRGMCCLLLLLNLGLILVTLGFVIVIQFFEPLFVWYVFSQHFLISKIMTRYSFVHVLYMSYII